MTINRTATKLEITIQWVMGIKQEKTDNRDNGIIIKHALEKLELATN